MSGAAEPVFTDTNVLLYALQPADEKGRRAAFWLDRLWRTGAGRLSWQVLHEFYANAVGKMRADVGPCRELARLYIRWRPVETTPGLIESAWGWVDSRRLAYWDALIIAAAERSGSRYLLSEDFPPGQAFGACRVLNPFVTAPADIGL